MAGQSAILTLPDGTKTFAPLDPRTWAADDRLGAKLLNRDLGAAVAWHRNRPFFQGLQTISQSIPVASTWTPITLDWEMIDAFGGHSGASTLWYNPYTQNNASSPAEYYLVSGYVPLNASDSTKVGLAGIIKNGSEIREGTKIPHNAGHVIDPMVIDLVAVTGGDTLALGAWTNVAAGASTSVSSKSPSLTARWVGSAVGSTAALPPTPHSWIPADFASASTTGASPRAGGSKVPLNTEIRDIIRFLNRPPLARLTAEGQSPVQAIPTGGTWTSVQLPLNNIDNYGGWSSGANTKYTVQRAGVYLCVGYGCFNEVSAAGGWRGVRLLVNGTTPYAGTTAVPQSTGNTGTALYAARHIRLAAGDTVEIQMANGGSSALNVNTSASGGSKLIMVWRGL